MTVRPGLTLLEVLVAMLIASIVASIGYLTFSSLMDQGERVLRQSEQSQIASVRRALETWIRAARLLPGSDESAFRGLDGGHADTPLDELRFLTAAQSGRGLTSVRIYIDVDSATVDRGLLAELETWGGNARHRMTLDSTIVGLDARYTSRLVASRRWLPSWISSTVLPDVVELRFVGSPASDALAALPLVVPVGPAK